MSTSIGLRTLYPSALGRAGPLQRSFLRIATARLHHRPATTSVLHRLSRDVQPRGISYHTRRHRSTDAQPEQRPLTDRDGDQARDLDDADRIAMRKALSPAYQLWFTCKTCLERSGHTVSKQSYHHGTCVIQCPTCKTQHLISDNLKIFSDTNLTMEDIARDHGEKLRKGRLGADGDIEFYDDTATEKIP